MVQEGSLFDVHAPPGSITQAASRFLAFARDRGLPFLKSADDTALRTMALGIRSAALRLSRGPLRSREEDTESSFVSLDERDRVTLLPDNREAFVAKCAAVERAQRSIDCALYYLADDATGARFADLLARASARGVRVRLGVDAHASVEKQYGPFGYATNASRGALALLETLRRAGCDVRLLGADAWSMHRKFLFVDREELVIGGRNVADHYAEQGWRDLELVLRGPFAESFGAAIDGTFARPTAAPPPARGVLVGVPGHSGAAFGRAIASLVEESKSTIDIEHAYLLSHPWLENGLRAAVERGVRVRAFSNSGASNDLPFMNWRLAVTARTLIDVGVRVFRRTTSAATLHTKLVIGDRRRVIFGSSNLDYYSPTFCAELDMAIDDADLGARLTAVIEAGLREPATQAVVPGAAAANDLERECSPWSVSRLCDLVMHDMQ